ncbi:MAG: hypothetical protein L0Z50_41530 [Verrucomicrobiales bacterium]|nr:hypothetical protein [Verrucomicrobiales bacterium]
MDNSIIGLLAKLFGAVAAICLGALVAQRATSRVAGFTPSYLNVLLPAFFGYGGALAVGFVLGYVSGLHRGEAAALGTLIDVVIGLFVQAAFYSLMLKDSDGKMLGYGQACLISLFQLVVVCVVFGVVILMLLGAGTLIK